MIKKLQKEAQEELWNKFKSSLGNSSIENKFNVMYDLAMYDLEVFITQQIQKAYKAGGEEERERIIDLADERSQEYNKLDREEEYGAIRAFID